MMSAQGYTTEEIADRLLTSSTLLHFGKTSKHAFRSAFAASRSADTMKYHRKKLLTPSTLLWHGRANELTLLSLCAASRKLGVETISEALATVMSSNVM